MKGMCIAVLLLLAALLAGCKSDGSTKYKLASVSTATFRCDSNMEVFFCDVTPTCTPGDNVEVYRFPRRETIYRFQEGTKTECMLYLRTTVHIPTGEDKDFYDAPPDLKIGESIKVHSDYGRDYSIKYRTSQGLEATAEFQSNGVFYSDPGFKVSPK